MVKEFLKKEKIPIILFVIGFIFSIWIAPYGTFCDEADVITASWLMSKGSLLYQDIFCHHMPVPYFFLEIFQFFSNDLIFLRICFAIVTQAYFVLLYVFFRKKLHPCIIPIVSVLWGLMRHILLQNMILADTFVALGLFTIFLELITCKNCKYALKDKILIAFATFISFGSSLIAVYPLMIFYLYYIVKRIILYIKEKENAFAYFKEDLLFALIVLCPFLVFVLYLLLTNTWGAFLENAIFFNTDYYSLYNGAETPISLIVNQFLDFPQRAWTRILFGTILLPQMLSYITDIFVGVNFVIFLAWSITALFRYKSKAILYILFVYFCYMRNGFHSSTFMIFCQFFLAEGIIWGVKEIQKKEKAEIQKAIAITGIFLYTLAYLFLLGIDLIKMVKGDERVTDYGKEYKDVILSVTEEDDTIWAVPLKAELYFVTNRMPANSNIFYLPWQSIKPGVNKTIEKDLLEKKPKVIIYTGDELLWTETIVTSSYCGWLEEILEENYFTVEGFDNVYFLKSS